MSLMTVYSDGGADYPDEAKWIPGELGEREQLHDDESLNIQLERSLVYPNGVLVTVTVRALVPPTREAQRSFSAGVVSFHEVLHTGPRLDRWSFIEHAWVGTEPWGHGGSNGHYVLPFWMTPTGEDSQAILLRFSWPARLLENEIRFSAEQVGEARARARKLFSGDISSLSS